MTVTAASFRLALPAFASTTTYPTDAVTFWIGVATLMLNPNSWGLTAVAVEPAAPGLAMTSKLDLGTILFVAHNLILEQLAAKSVAAGGVPGMSGGGGPVSSKSVGPVSQSYDTTAGLELEAGHWNLTIYGTRFVRLANMLGTRIMTVGGYNPVWSGTEPYYSGGAWPGPPGGLFPWW